MPHIIIETSQNIQLRQADTLLKKLTKIFGKQANLINRLLLNPVFTNQHTA